MLNKIEFENFRCFGNHVVPFKNRTIIVGKNNAGKSTIVEGLRLIWLALEKCRAIHYSAPPRWMELPKAVRGITPSLDNQAFNFEKVFHQHNPPPARVTGFFSSGATVSVYVGPENAVYAVFRNKQGYVAKSRAETERIAFPSIGILHQVAPVRSTERVIDEDRVRHCLNSSLTPIHFRNQLRLLKDQYFAEFKEIAESTWHGLQIRELLETPAEDGVRLLQLMVRNEDFVADISWMGHGLQMWLQAMWFVARTQKYHTVILDEPDVYMHADLQRKLIRLLRHRYPQVIVATHSFEIMDEVDAEDILTVDRDKREAKFATDWPEVQHEINSIGGAYNLQLTRLEHSKRFLFVEGKDTAILKRIQDTLFPESEFPLKALPALPVGGWGGWDKVVGSRFFLRKVLEGAKVYCVLDSDYRIPEQIAFRRQEAAEAGVQLKIRGRKEIENYLLVPAAIARAASKSGRKKLPAPEDIRERLESIAEECRPEVVMSVANEYKTTNNKWSVRSSMEAAEDCLREPWQSFEGKMGVISGKSALNKLNSWLAEFKVSLTVIGIASELKADEIHSDLKDFFERFEDGEGFS